MVRRSSLLLSITLLFAACETEHACRPGTLFVRAMLDETTAAADTLQVRLHRDGRDDDVLAPFARHGSGAGVESFEISFASYTPGVVVTVDVVALAQGMPVGEIAQPVTLTAGCTTATLPLYGAMTPTTSDMAVGGGDVIDLATPPDVASSTTFDMATPVLDLTTLNGSPDAPGAVTATAKPGVVVQLSWTAPNDHGSAITGYSVQSSPGGFTTTVAGTSVTTSALAVGTSYTFDVRAINGVGTGLAGTSASVVAGDVPGAPTNVHATANGLSASVTWSAPPADGYAISGYTVTADNAGGSVDVAASQTSTSFGGLKNGQSYHFTVTAKNALGSSSASVASNAITASCTNTAYSMYAVDMTTVQYVGDPNTVAINYIEARHDVRPPPFVNRDTTGWALFHLADPPNGPPATAAVVAVELTLNVSTTISNPAPTLVEIWYSQDDGWRSTQVLTSNDVRRTQKVSHSPVPPGQANAKLVVSLDVPPTAGAWDWSKDLTDRYITVGAANADLTDQLSYIRFQDATAGATAVPVLKVTVCQ
jgi:hypothetical protein